MTSPDLIPLGILYEKSTLYILLHLLCWQLNLCRTQLLCAAEKRNKIVDVCILISNSYIITLNYNI